MKINRLKVKGLHDYLDKDLDFQEDISILVGINGSGKTSILNIISWLIKPSLPDLATTIFKKIELEFDFDKDKYALQCSQTKDSIKIEIKNLSTNEHLYPLNLNLLMDPSLLSDADQAFINDLKSKYNALGPDQDEMETWEFFRKELPEPVLIGLDRNLDQSLFGSDETKRINEPRLKREKQLDPIEIVKNIIRDSRSQYKNKVLELSNDLNTKILKLAFQTFEENDIETPDPRNFTEKDFDDLKRKIRHFADNYITESDKFLEEVLTEVDKMIDLVNDENNFDLQKGNVNEFILAVLNVSQYKKVFNIYKEFENYEEKSNREYKDINDFVVSINKFFKDSNKELTFDENTNNPTFKIYKANEKFIKSNEDIKNLSSGEKQLLILFTYLKFNLSSGNILLIDEPELSLHQKWQNIFLETVRTLKPYNSQVFLATHSPSIVGEENKHLCNTLLPYNE